MNHIYRLVWSKTRRMLVAVAETAGSGSKGGSARLRRARAACARFKLAPVASLLLLCGLLPGAAVALPSGAQVAAGQATISQSGSTLTVTQGTDKTILNWNSFGIGAGETVNFLQPGAGSVALNRVTGNQASAIYGRLNANGQVFLVNPNGVYFAPGAQVNVGGILASTLNISNSDFLNGSYRFSGDSAATVTNAGSINAAQGGYIAFIGNRVSNDGTLTTPGGTTALGAGNSVTLTLTGNRLLSFSVDGAAFDAQAENGGLIQADGGWVILTAQARDALLDTVVNNTGVIRAQTVAEHEGSIVLLGGNEGTTKVSGTLDASAPNGGNGGFIETSGAHLKVADGTVITTKAASGNNGLWLVDPVDFTIAASGGDITGATLSAALANGDVEIQSVAGTVNVNGNGDINVNDAVSWDANTLTLTAEHAVNVNAVMTAGGTAGLVFNTAVLEDGVSTGGLINMKMGNGGFIGRVDFTGIGNTITINGRPGVIITTLGEADSLRDNNSLQGMGSGVGGPYVFVLGADIDASPTASWNNGQGFAPVWGGILNFPGTFNGLGHIIDGLTINRPTEPRVGLIKKLDGSSILNVGLTNVDIVGGRHTGAFVGIIDNGRIANAFVTGSVKGTEAFVGGLVGYIWSNVRISNASFEGAVSSTFTGLNPNASDSNDWASVGGLLGYMDNKTSITNSYFSGTVTGPSIVGGLVGTMRAYDYKIENCYVNADLNGVDAGGLIGIMLRYDPAGLLSNLYFTGSITTTSFLRGYPIVSFNSGLLTSFTNAYFNHESPLSADGTDYDMSHPDIAGDATGLTAAQMKQQASFVGFDFDNTWVQYDGHTHPLLRSFMTPLTVTADNLTQTYNGGASVPGALSNPQFSLPGADTSGDLFGLSDPYAGYINAGTYDPNLWSHQRGYVISYSGAALTIDPAVLTLSGITANNKVYDGTTATTLNTAEVTVTGLIGSDTVTVADTVGGNFADRHVGTDIAVTLSNSALSGPHAGNYIYATQPEGLTADITPKVMTLTAPSLTKVYDGTLDYTTTIDDLNALTALLADGDTVTSASFAYTDRHAGSGNKTVTMSDVSYDDGNGGANYILTPAGNSTSSITPAPLTLSGITADNKVYDATTAATLNTTEVTFSGLIGTDSVTLGGTGVGNFTDRHVGTDKTVIVSGYTLGGDNSGDYMVAQPVGLTADITPATLTVSGLGSTDKRYDGLTSFIINYGTLSGQFAEDDVFVIPYGVTVYTADKNVGTDKPIVSATVSLSGLDAGNYTAVANISGLVGRIVQRDLILRFSPADKVYDGTTTATMGPATVHDGYYGIINGDDITITGITGSFSDKNVGTGKTVTLDTYNFAGADAGNYDVATVSVDFTDITPAPLTLIGITADNKVYNGNLAAALNTTGVTFSGLIGTDSVTLGGTGVGNFTDRHVGTGKTVIVSGYTLNGAEAGNYMLGQPAGLTADITPALLTLGGITAGNKVYDGTTGAVVNTAGAIYTGLRAGDSVSVSATGSFADKNVGTGKTVTLASTYSGADVGNYSIIDQASATADITQAALTLSGITADNKVYDGTTGAVVNTAGAIYTGLIAGDSVSVSATGSFADKNVGTGKTVTLASTYSGADVGNYSIIDQASATANVTQAALSLSGITADNKVYDGTTDATLTGTATLNPLSGDTVTLSGTGVGSFADKHVGAGKAVTISGYTLGGADAGNYTVGQPAGLTADITPAALTMTGITAADKVYDGTTTATVDTSGATGWISGDAVTVSATGSFADKHAGVGKTVTLASTYSGADLGNYTITDQASTTADITPKAITLSAPSVSKTYDGTTAYTTTAGDLSTLSAALVGGDSVTAATIGYATPTAGSNKTVSLDSATVSDGNGGANYIVALAGNSTSTIIATDPGTPPAPRPSIPPSPAQTGSLVSTAGAAPTLNPVRSMQLMNGSAKPTAVLLRVEGGGVRALENIPSPCSGQAGFDLAALGERDTTLCGG